MEKVEPIKRIFMGRVAGDDVFKDIYPPSYCPRDGYKLKRQEDDSWTCPHCGRMVMPGR